MSAEVVAMLRRQLREKFPQAHGLRTELEPAAPTAGPFAAEVFPAGAISEVVPAGPAAGLLLWLAGLLGEPEAASPHPELALVDGADGFDPGSFSSAACSRVLWVRCTSAMEMLKAAELLVRDGNLPMVLLDACGLPRRELGGLSGSSWWRLKQVAEHSRCRLVVMASQTSVPCASRRLVLSADLSLGDFDLPRDHLLERLRTEPRNLKQVN